MANSHLIRINDVTISIAHLLKIALDEPANRVIVFVKNKPDPFLFFEDSRESSISLYLDLCNLLRSTQQEIPFLFFSNLAIKLETITSIHLEHTQIIVSLTDQNAEAFNFPDLKVAKETFDALMASMGMGNAKDKAEEVTKLDKTPNNKKETPNEKKKIPVPKQFQKTKTSVKKKSKSK